MTDFGGYLGGDRQSMAEIADRVRRVLGPLPHLNMGWPWQCRCGSTTWIKYRGRFYSPCGRRWPNPDVRLPGRDATFREAYNAQDAVARCVHYG